MKKELIRCIENDLLNKVFLKENGFSRKEMKAFLAEEAVQKGLASLKADRKDLCAFLAGCLGDSLRRWAEEPPEGWIRYVIRSTVHEMFPGREAGESFPEKYIKGKRVLLQILRTVLREEKETDPEALRTLAFLPAEEVADCRARGEYETLERFWKDHYLNEFMFAYKEATGFDTLGHIWGVHRVAVFVGRQLARRNVPIDLALVSGAAIGHDIGKFGCGEKESSRIPYLHYYYTDLFFKNHHMPMIGHIATNHSTWDLELENLSVESLVLIYSDFRVKSIRDPHGKEQVRLYDMKASFDVILGKLDNVDEAKKLRYRKVYAKIRDFEEYMKKLGVETAMDSGWSEPDPASFVLPEARSDALLTNREVIARLKALAVEHNIVLMNLFNDEVKFGNLLEAARSEKQWKQIRAYLNIFYEYSTYMTQKQKGMTLDFLYELLMHREGDIRRLAAELLGIIIVSYDEEYRKELPEGAVLPENRRNSREIFDDIIHKIIFPEHKITEAHKRWIGHTLKIFFTAVLSRIKEEERAEYLGIVLRYYCGAPMDDATVFVLLDAMLYLPLTCCPDREQKSLLDFSLGMLSRPSAEVRIGALRAVQHFLEEMEGTPFIKEARETVLKKTIKSEESHLSIIYLKYKILSALKGSPEKIRQYYETLYKGEDAMGDLFLENLKVGTSWVIKAVNIEYLMDRLAQGILSEKLHISTHLSNLLKVSERVSVRHSAGAGLCHAIQFLSLDQRNEIVIELTKGLEVGEYQFSKYIPEYLGEIALFLHPNELDELISQLKRLLESTNDRIVSVSLNTIGVLLYKYPGYRGRFREDLGKYEARRETLAGMLLAGLANYNPLVSQEAFHVIGRELFGSKALSLEEKENIFRLIYKKMLTLITEQEESELGFFNSAASLNHLYRFISEYTLAYGEFNFPEPEKVAFFPGTFDPFSLSHKGIVNAILQLGCEVYLAIDEFSWSKKTQPRKNRRKIITMSVAGQREVFVMPDEIQVNLSNRNDLKRLSELFPGKELYIVVGSDVIANASSYRKPAEEGSIHFFNHIVFGRSSQSRGTEIPCDPEEVIRGKVVRLSLPVHLEDISSSRIRENIDFNRDISNLIDAVAQNYIYDNSLYLREPLYKSVILSKRIILEKVERFDRELMEQLAAGLLEGKRNTEEILSCLVRKNVRGILVRDGKNNGEIVGFSAYSLLETSELYEEFFSLQTASRMREEGTGKRVLISQLHCRDVCGISDVAQLVLTETLADCLQNDYTYAIFHPHGYRDVQPEVLSVLRRQGFEEIRDPDRDAEDIIYRVDMRWPVVLLTNVGFRIKFPFNENERISRAISDAHENFQRALTRLFPGTLVLSFNQEIIHNRLISMITRINGVPEEPQAARILGPYMCVPFGKILNGMVVPNTVTKTLHTEKYFNPRISDFTVKEYPNYSLIQNQIKTIKSFDREVLLVDDILHKGYRIREMDPILKEEEVYVKKIMVGILSGRGKDLMTIQNRDVDSAYFVPNLRVWFLESSMYPFLGGDSVMRKGNPFRSGLLNSINLILPYVAPRFLSSATHRQLYDFSMECLKNARHIIAALEEEYEESFNKKLTLNRLGEAIVSPKIPDIGDCLEYDFNQAPSVFVENDIERLTRLHNMLV